MVNPKFQHHTPFVLPAKVTMNLATLHCIIHIHQRQRSITLYPNFSNDHIAMRHKTQHLRNPHETPCTHSLHRYFSGFYFHPPLSATSFQAYASWEGLDTPPLSIYLGEWTVKYSLKHPPSPKQGFFGMVQTLWYLLFSTLLDWGIRTN